MLEAMKLRLKVFLMLVADMAECLCAAVVAALPARVGAGHSIGKTTCRTSTSRPVTLSVRAQLVPVDAFLAFLV